MFTKLMLAMGFFQYLADAVTAAAIPPVVKPELTSEKLVALKAAATIAWNEISKYTDPFSTEAKNAKLAFLKAEGEMNAEIAALNKAEADAKIQEARNERLKLVENLLTAHSAVLGAPKTATAETKAALQSTFDTAKEAVSNELLAKFAGSKPAKAATDGVTAGTGRDTVGKAEILELARSGKTNAEIVALGHARSTVWHTINNAKKAGETFPNA